MHVTHTEKLWVRAPVAKEYWPGGAGRQMLRSLASAGTAQVRTISRAVGARTQVPSARSLHYVPKIGLEEGSALPGLFSKEGLDIAWFQYQKHLITEINRFIEQHGNLGKYESVFDLMKVALRSTDPQLRPLAALASQAYTNEFFFRSLRKEGSVNPQASFVSSPEDERRVDISNTVLNMPRHPDVASGESLDITSMQGPSYPSYRAITDRLAFGSMAAFRELLINRGEAVFGNGAIWLVQAASRDKTGLLNTYGWGTPFSHAAEELSENASLASTSMALETSPALCVNVWEHVYLHDYGVAGKRRFLENAFDCIDWDVVDKRLSRA